MLRIRFVKIAPTSLAKCYDPELDLDNFLDVLSMPSCAFKAASLKGTPRTSFIEELSLIKVVGASDFMFWAHAAKFFPRTAPNFVMPGKA